MPSNILSGEPAGVIRFISGMKLFVSSVLASVRYTLCGIMVKVENPSSDSFTNTDKGHKKNTKSKFLKKGVPL
jgi:hypothetical protein